MNYDLKTSPPKKNYSSFQKEKKTSRFPLTDIKPHNKEFGSSQQSIHNPYRCYYVPKLKYTKRSKEPKIELITIE